MLIAAIEAGEEAAVDAALSEFIVRGSRGRLDAWLARRGGAIGGPPTARCVEDLLAAGWS
ncbi:MAG: hypothetical protein ACRD1K_07900 [Acidimicrobiales bacterium]